MTRRGGADHRERPELDSARRGISLRIAESGNQLGVDLTACPEHER